MKAAELDINRCSSIQRPTRLVSTILWDSSKSGWDQTLLTMACLVSEPNYILLHAWGKNVLTTCEEWVEIHNVFECRPRSTEVKSLTAITSWYALRRNLAHIIITERHLRCASCLLGDWIFVRFCETCMMARLNFSCLFRMNTTGKFQLIVPLRGKFLTIIMDM